MPNEKERIWNLFTWTSNSLIIKLLCNRKIAFICNNQHWMSIQIRKLKVGTSRGLLKVTATKPLRLIPQSLLPNPWTATLTAHTPMLLRDEDGISRFVRNQVYTARCSQGVSPSSRGSRYLCWCSKLNYVPPPQRQCRS